MMHIKKTFCTKDAIYFKGDKSILKACKKTQRLSVIGCGSEDLGAEVGDIVTVLGRLSLDEGDYVLVVTNVTEVAKFHSNELMHPIYRIERVRALPIMDDGKVFRMDSVGPGQGSGAGGAAAQAANKLRIGQRALMKFVTDKIPGNTPTLLDEVLRLFNDVPDFYFCFERDITNSTQKHFAGATSSDERFFWNRRLLDDLFFHDVPSTKAEWIVPIVQGHVQCHDLSLLEDFDNPSILRITIISRRCIHRAGVRYLRRGIDSDSNVANFVETELLLNVFDHHLSFVQIRGSVPLYWSQKGLKYRPPLTIDKSIDDSLPVFAQHCSKLLEDYGSPLVMVNLVDQTGRELKLATAYLEHAVKNNNEDTQFYSFDFHHHCRGLNFEKVNNLVSSLENSLSDIGFCWVDKTGEVVRKQKGIVRTNCVDCLDRTNVVQGSISQWMCMQQSQRLGLFGPLADPPESLVQALQIIWADNGDSISTQYAGTAALKGDMTRYGERKLTGIMKDGYNSASRYYLSHVRDATRQRAINALLSLEEEVPSTEDESDSDEDANVGRLVAETTHFLLPENEILVGGWALIDSHNTQAQVDSVVLLSRTTVYVALYDDDSEKLLEVRIVPFEEIEALEIGRPSRSSRVHLRLLSRQGSWAWRAANTRLFNNVAIRIKNEDEADEYVESIGEQLRVTIEMMTGRNIEIVRKERLQTGGGNVNRRALVNMVSSVFGRSRRTTPPPLTITNGDEMKSTVDQANALAAVLSAPSHSSTLSRPSSAIPFEGESVHIQEGTDIEAKDGHLDLPPGFRTSVSDGRLCEKTSATSSSSNFVSRLRGLRPPLFKQDGTVPHQSPFHHLIPQIENSKAKIVLL